MRSVGRFAPTPSGRMHLGNLFSALLAWLSVRSQGGELVLRMEDLDTQRTNAGYASQLRRDLTWLGLTWDRETTPQSQRQEAYQAAFRLLEEMGLLYPCYCTRSRLHRIDAPHATDGVYVYDGRCRNRKPEEWAAFGRTVYPKICPAVIVAVCHGDRLLLTKYAGRSFRRYALVAGFNEIGESIEETVRREVLEETGLQVDNLRFYKSQPWVVTDSLLFGFFAELAGPDCIHLQEEELAEAQWFPRNALPTDHSSDSLTGEMIEIFRAGKEPR